MGEQAVTWTTTIPTEPGYYWWRNPINRPRILEIDEAGFLVVGKIRPSDCKNMAGEWAGPIEEPKE